MSVKQKDRRFRRLLRLPSFGVALGVSVAALIAFAVWMFIDASFSYTLLVVQGDFGVKNLPGDRLAAAHAWDKLGPRLSLFATLFAVGALASLTVVYRTIIGRREGRSLRSLFLTMTLVAGWMTLGLYHDRFDSAGFSWRVDRALEGIKKDAEILSANWPTTAGVLPYSGAYTVDDAVPQRLSVHSSWAEYVMKERVGPWIMCGGNGELRFDYSSQLTKVEYHPRGRPPNSFSQKIQSDSDESLFEVYQLEEFSELEPNWFVVKYGSMSWRSNGLDQSE